jgi:hypothetical protein
MGKREVTILDNAVTSLAEISYFIESKALRITTKNLWMMFLHFLVNFPTKK